MIRSFVLSSVLAATAACALLNAPQASARALGGFSIDTTGPITPTPLDPWGGVQLCTAHLRRPVFDQWGNFKGWEYHMASGYDYWTCLSNASMYMNMGYQHNPNPGFGLCQCHSGYNGYIVSNPSGTNPLGVQNMNQEQMHRYDEGLLRLRQKYQLDRYAEEHELLLQSIESAPAASEGN